MNPFLRRSLEKKPPVSVRDMKRRAYLSGQHDREQETLYTKLPLTVRTATDWDKKLLNSEIYYAAEDLMILLRASTKIGACEKQSARTHALVTDAVEDFGRYTEDMLRERRKPMARPAAIPPRRLIPVVTDVPEEPEAPSLFHRVLSWFTG